MSDVWFYIFFINRYSVDFSVFISKLCLILLNRHNIVHRDLKPSNIFFDDDGTAKIGDLGLGLFVSKEKHIDDGDANNLSVECSNSDTSGMSFLDMFI